MSEAEELGNIREELIEEAGGQKVPVAFSITKAAAERRRKKPTGERNYSESTGKRRRLDTIAAVSAIHGGQNSSKPGTIGMLETLDRRCKQEDIVDGMKRCPKLKDKVLPKVYKEDLKRYESSSDNMLRSIAVYYRKGVMGKDKYRLVYKDSSYKHKYRFLLILV